jgi:hypothetical protein
MGSGANGLRRLEQAIVIATEQEVNFRKVRFDNPKWKGGFKETNEKQTSSKERIKCHRCGKMEHYANECRNTEPRTSFRNPSN